VGRLRGSEASLLPLFLVEENAVFYMLSEESGRMPMQPEHSATLSIVSCEPPAFYWLWLSVHVPSTKRGLFWPGCLAVLGGCGLCGGGEGGSHYLNI